MFRKAITALLARTAVFAVLAISALAQAESSWGQQAGLTNPGFEAPRVEEGTFVLADVLLETMPGWKTTDTHFEIWGTGFKGVPAHEGTQFVELNAFIDGTLYQDSTGIQQGSVLEFTFAHRGRNGDDTMKLTITDLGADNSLGGGDDTVLFTKEFTTGKDAWAVYDSTTEQQIVGLGNTVRFGYGAVSTATGELGEGNLLDAANFGIGVVSAPAVSAMEFKLIPAGTFLMGSPDSEEGRDDDERQHEVTITRDFYMGVTEVTQSQWQQVMGTTPWKGQENVIEGDDVAASYISWNDAVEFCQRLSQQEGRTYRLPTEAEWEYACRAGSTTAYSFGDDASQLEQYAWYFDSEPAHPSPVKQKSPNGFGLYDMHGNVWEHCQDWYSSSYGALASDQSSPSQQAGLAGLTNPGFEAPRVKEGTFELADVLLETVPGWKTTDTHFEIWGTGFKEVPAHEGTQFVELNAYIDGTLYQDSTGIEAGSLLEFTFAHRGRNGDDTMKLTITDLGADNAIGGGDDTVLFTKQYTTGNDAWAVYNSTTEEQIKALGNTVRFGYGAVSTATGELGEGNLLDAADFGIGVVSIPRSVIDPTGPSSGSERIKRSGSFLTKVPYLRSAVRQTTKDLAVGENSSGFRVVMVPGSDSGAQVMNPLLVTPEVAIVKTQLANGSFEEPRGIDNGFVFSQLMPGWKTTDEVFEIWSTGFKGFEAHDGTQFVELNATLDGTLYQDLTGIGQGAVLDFSFAHRGRNGSDKMSLTVIDLGADNAIGGGDDTVLFVNNYITSKDAWAVYDSTTEDPILARGNTIRLAFTAIHGTGENGPDRTEGNLLDSVKFGVDVPTSDRRFTLEEAKQILIGSWKADLDKTESRYGELNQSVRPMVADGLFLTFSTNASLEIGAGDLKVAFDSYKIEGPAVSNDFNLVTLRGEEKATEFLRIIDNNLIILKSSDDATPLVLERQVGAISSDNNEPSKIPQDLSGKFVISSKAVEGDNLAIWTYGNIVSYIGPEATWTLKKLSDDGEKRIYSLEQKGQYLSVKDGKLVPSKTPGQWVLWDNGGLYSIMWYEDETKGANCISLIEKGEGYAPLMDGHAHYALELARNNGGGEGNAHQLWELTKKE